MNETQWLSFFAAHESELFDYMVRMCGQLDRSEGALLEVRQAMGPMVQTLEGDPDKLRTMIFATARSFNADIWNADTRALGIPDYPSIGRKRGNLEDLVRQRVRQTENALRGVSALLKETLLLRWRYGFSEEATSHIMGMPLASVRQYETEGMSAMRGRLLQAGVSSDSPESGDEISRSGLGNLARYPLPARSRHHTTDLSAVISDIRASRGYGLGGKKFLYLAILIVLFLAALYWLS